MVLNTKDLQAMAKIGTEAAVKFVEENEMETEVLRWKLRIGTQADAAQDCALMSIWTAMGTYVLGKLCREWIAYGCGMKASDVLDALTGEDGEQPTPSLFGSEV